MDQRRYRLAEILARESVFHQPRKPFVLASGKKSAFYFDCRRTTMLPDAMPLIGSLLLDRIRDGVEGVGGMTMGADPIACAVAFASTRRRRKIPAFSVRKAAKQHGRGRWIEGAVAPRARVAIVEDVVTTGGSTLDAIERCREEGLRVEQVLVLVDREEGAIGKIEAVVGDGRVEALFRRSEIDAVWKAARGRR